MKNGVSNVSGVESLFSSVNTFRDPSGNKTWRFLEACVSLFGMKNQLFAGRYEIARERRSILAFPCLKLSRGMHVVAKI